MGPTWGRHDPGGCHVGHANLAIWVLVHTPTITSLAMVQTQIAYCGSETITRNTRWRHQVEAFSAFLALCEGNHRSPVDFHHKGQRRGALMFSLICAWINGWVNDWDVGGLKRHRAYHDATVMGKSIAWIIKNWSGKVSRPRLGMWQCDVLSNNFRGKIMARWYNQNKPVNNKTVCIFYEIYSTSSVP